MSVLACTIVLLFLLVPPTALAQATDAPASAAVTEAAAGPEAERYLRGLIAAVQDHPSLRAAAAAAVAAERQLQAARQPLQFQAEASWTRLTVTGEGADAVPQPDPRASFTATAHPFLYGDLADLEAQRSAELARAQLALREARTQIEIQAIEAAGGVIVAERALALARQGLELAAQAVEIASERLERGAARDADVDRARQERAQAEAEVDRAQDNLAYAQRSLATLTGDAALPPLPGRLPDVRPVVGIAPSVVRAELDLALAEVGLGAARRNLYPVGQASYTYNFEEDRGALTLGLESRTLSPSLTYRTGGRSDDAGGGTSGSGPSAFADVRPMQTMPEPPRVAGSFTVGVSVTLSPERFYAVDAAVARVDAATAGLVAARERSALDDVSLENAIAAAERDVDLARTAVAIERAAREDVARRVELGLATRLDLDRASLAVARSELALVQARQALRRAHLNTYSNVATPVSEVLP